MCVRRGDARSFQRDALVQLPPVWAMLVIAALSLASWAVVILSVLAVRSILD